MERQFKNGVWPVMLTPFTSQNKVDYPSLERLVEWYIQAGVAGLFAVCQSSEMFYLSLEERVAIARFVRDKAAGRVPVIASGHISDHLEEQAAELGAMAETGVDALILITNRLAGEEEADRVWLANLETLIKRLPQNLPLGFYECPYPYKRILTPECLRWCVDTGRFHFLKDTSCDMDNMREKMRILAGSSMKLFNANSATLLHSLREGAAGFSGVMANFHPALYVWLCESHAAHPETAERVADYLSVAALIERQVYPVNAKYFQQIIGNFTSIHTRAKDPGELVAVARLEVEQHARLTRHFSAMLPGPAVKG